ncbi:MAG TPA: phage portal protein [Sumerlaeia bacterium]|nr:phage portal protein [Sumerlaeia bacterium]
MTPDAAYAFKQCSTRGERAVDFVVETFLPHGQRSVSLRRHFRRYDRDEEYRRFWEAALHARGYGAAKTGTTTTPWLEQTGEADRHIIPDLKEMMTKSRALNRKDPIGSGISNTFISNVVGIGIRGQARTDDRDRNEKIEQVFRDRQDHLALADDLTFAEFQQMVFAKVLEDGGSFSKRARRFPGEPLWFETIEKDRVATPLGQQPQDPKGSIREGVEKDAAGVPVAIWVCKQHPGAFLGISGFGSPVQGAAKPTGLLSADNFVRVPIDEIKHIRLHPRRPGQTHGVPLFHAILQDIHDLDLLMIAALKRVQIAACLALFIKTEVPIDQVVDLTAEKYGFQLKQEIEPGMMFSLHPGESIETLVPNFPIPELAPFIITLSRRIGAALGLPWQVVLKDFGDSTYSSARTDLLEARQVYRIFQAWLSEKWLTWVWVTVLEDAKLRGDRRLAGVPPDDFRKVQWIATGWSWVDPVKDAKAAETELRIGAIDEYMLAASKGRDYEEVYAAQCRAEKFRNDTRKKMGLAPLPPGLPVAPISPKEVTDDDSEDAEKEKAKRAQDREAASAAAGTARAAVA